MEFEAGLQVLREMDKLDKVGIESVEKSITRIVGKEKSKKIMDFIAGKLDVKSEVGGKELKDLMQYLEQYGIKNYVIDRKLVRGIAYYDGNIFEFIADSGPYKGTIAAGGRYDMLSKQFNSDIPATGCAIGFERIFEIFKSSFQEEFSEKYCVVSIDNDKEAIKIAMALRSKGRTTDLLLSDKSLSKALTYCNSKKIRYAVLIGNKDLKEGLVTVRDLKEKKDTKLKLSDF